MSAIGLGAAGLGGAIIGVGYFLGSDTVEIIGAMTSIVGIGTYLTVEHGHKIYLLEEQTKELRAQTEELREIRQQNRVILKDMGYRKLEREECGTLEGTIYVKEK